MKKIIYFILILTFLTALV
ncbi:lipoprotein [Methanobrevibacter sp.]|nr:lipoprotein [Methanobrevibacter sp.]